MVKGSFNRFLLGASIATALLLLLVGYSYMVNPLSFPLAGPLGLFFPVVLALNVALLLLFLLFRKYRLMLVPFVGLLLAYTPVRIYCPFNMPKEAPAEGCITFMTYNALSFHGQHAEYGFGSDNPVVQYLLSLDCDVVCTQEDCWFMADSVEDVLREKYPHIRHIEHENRDNGLGIYSRFPVVRLDTIPLNSFGNMAAAFYLRLPHDSLLVVSAHLETNGLTGKDKLRFRTMMKGSMGRDSVKEESLGIYAKLARASQTRTHQIQKIMDYIHQHQGMKIILCGDFNESPLSYPHYLASLQLTDCYTQSARGLGWTYCHNAMRVRIDNIFCSHSIQSYSCWTDNSVPYSDHFPLFAKLKIE